MSNSLEIVDIKETSIHRNLCFSHKKNKHKPSLQSGDNIFKSKCNRKLKKKLRKYKLRRDGIEDPDILDVSKILVTSLRIKSPIKQDKINCNNNIIEQEEFNHSNYLTRMVRKKKICTGMEQFASINDDKSNKARCLDLSDDAGDKKRMDAFKLMMESRNKSIGSNSPGKDKVDEPELEEVIERKDMKAKRIISLQKMALAKGSLKNKEIEELRDKCIEKKMVKRAEKFKQMITKPDSKSEHKETKNMSKQKNNINELESKLEQKTFQLYDIFNDILEPTHQSKQTIKIPKDDIEFLKKLSPSIKKKDNMLSYFHKIPKEDSDCNENECTLNSEKSVIKVKFNLKRKKKTKILKLNEEIQETLEPIKKEITIIRNSNTLHSENHQRLKRKRNLNIEQNVLPSVGTSNLTLSNNESRPKRNVKKPLKYTEDIDIFSSDEELHIFTPKKKKNDSKTLKGKVAEPKRHEKNDVKNVNKKKIGIMSEDTVLEVSKKDVTKNKLNKPSAITISKNKNKSTKSLKLNNDKKVKLAPIFVTKAQLSPADIVAKQKFLKSGVPEKLKKRVETPTNVVSAELFPSVVHIQQNMPDVSLHEVKDWFNSLLDIDDISIAQEEFSFKNLLMLKKSCSYKLPAISKPKLEKSLQNIKKSYPKFPVYRTYHLLNGKRKGEFNDYVYPDLDNSSEIVNGQCVDINNENPDQLNWCDKYKPSSSKQIIGNFETIKELKKWLETWTENLFKAAQNVSDSSDFSDFYSDTDSRDINKNTNNVLILTGQTGSGKTSSVYAVASELAIKVIEVNASNKRTGKIMLQDLQEATQSHKVDRGKSGSDNSQKLSEDLLPINMKKRGRPKKVYNGKLSQNNKVVRSQQFSQDTKKNSQSQILASTESIRTGMSLILIDDADIIFEQDDGFCSAISQIIQSSKRPVILVTSSLTCPHLQKFIQYGKILNMHPISSRMLGTWLDVMCVVDVGKCCMGLGAKILDFYKGDIRKTINCLQFYMNSYKMTQGDEDALSQLKHNIDDENSSMSWIDTDSSDHLILNDMESVSYIDKQLQLLHVGCPLNVSKVWWNLPNLYNHSIDTTETRNLSNMKCTMPDILDRLNKLANVLDTISVMDYFDHTSPDINSNVSVRSWCTLENASVHENENFEGYSMTSVVTEEISEVLVKNIISTAQKDFSCENSLNFPSPNISILRNRDKIVSRHSKLSSHLHASVALDRRAAVLDYWPICRTICRIERHRTDSTVKRNNRFCHYLKSLNILGKNDFFDSLADSLT